MIRVMQPAREKDFSFQPKSLAQTLSKMKSKARLFRPSVVMGTPRYFPKSMERRIPSLVSMKLMLSSLVREEKKIFDFLEFTF